jgi:hypothetical protein
MQSRLGAMRLPPLPKTKEDLRGHCVTDSDDGMERSVRTWVRKRSVEIFPGVFEKCRLLAEVCGELWKLCRKVTTGDKRAHFKNYIHVSFIKIFLLKQK